MDALSINKEISVLITHLKNLGQMDLARLVEHRAYKVSWTTQREMLEEILYIINKNANQELLKRDEIKQFINLIKNYLK